MTDEHRAPPMMLDEVIQTLQEMRALYGNIPVCCEPYEGHPLSCQVTDIVLTDNIIRVHDDTVTAAQRRQGYLPIKDIPDPKQPKCIYIGSN